MVRAPATVANLGAGFDCLGLALAWYDEVRVERHDGPLEITASGLSAEGVRRDDTNSIAQGLARVLGSTEGLRIHKMTAVAFGRGFGSSASSIVAGLVAGRALGDTAHSDDDLLEIATELEGHPDNVAPCLLGGITISTPERTYRLDAPDAIMPLVCVAREGLPTSKARGVVPDDIPRPTAVANAARAALLAATLASGGTTIDPARLLDATEDLLHQPARFALMPETGALVGKLRAAGIAAFLSGAGPSVTALVPRAHAADAEAHARTQAPEGWDVRLEAFAQRGAEVVETR